MTEGTGILEKAIKARTVMIVKQRKCAARMKFQDPVMREACTCKCRMGGRDSSEMAFPPFFHCLFNPSRKKGGVHILVIDMRQLILMGAKWMEEKLQSEDLLIPKKLNLKFPNHVIAL